MVVLEHGRCGDQASGRNGGFASASLTHGHGNGNGAPRWPQELATLDRLGAENLDAIGATVDRFGIGSTRGWSGPDAPMRSSRRSSSRRSRSSRACGSRIAGPGSRHLHGFAAFYGTAYAGRVGYALGFTGLGVAATRFVADVVLDLLDGADTERTRLRMVREKPLPFPPEPLRFAGVQLTRWSMALADANGGRPNLWLRSLDRRDSVSTPDLPRRAQLRYRVRARQMFGMARIMPEWGCQELAWPGELRDRSRHERTVRRRRHHARAEEP